MVRFARPQLAAAVFLCSLGCAARVAAQDAAPAAPLDRGDASALELVAPPPPTAAAAPASRRRRPSALVPLYVSFGALQGLDSHSTSRAIGRGAVEANPLMKGLAGNEIGMLAVKAGGAAVVIYASEKMWKQNRTAAVIFMIAANSALGWVVQHNYRAVR